ncbi:MAG TPA: response regulator [Bacteroidetes bacterium]|nr:response regulator [Bacteroidota bacterium]
MSKKDILIIDDSNTNLVLLESLLKRNGYSVFSATNGRLGLDMVNKNIPDLIFLDIKMPGLGGFEFIEILKRNEDFKNIPVVILSAVSDRESIKKSQELGVCDYLTKPLSLDRILNTARNILEE